MVKVQAEVKCDACGKHVFVWAEVGIDGRLAVPKPDGWSFYFYGTVSTRCPECFKR